MPDDEETKDGKAEESGASTDVAEPQEQSAGGAVPAVTTETRLEIAHTEKLRIRERFSRSVFRKLLPLLDEESLLTYEDISAFEDRAPLAILEAVIAQSEGKPTPSQIFQIAILIKGYDFYEGDLNKFHEFQAALLSFTGVEEMAFALLSAKLPPHHNKPPLLQECVKTFSGLDDGENESLAMSLFYAKRIYGGDMNKFRACARYIKEGKSAEAQAGPLIPSDRAQLDEFIDGAKYNEVVAEGMDLLYDLTDGEPQKLKRLKEAFLKACIFEGENLANSDAVRSLGHIKKRQASYWQVDREDEEVDREDEELSGQELFASAQAVDLDFLEVCAEGIAENSAGMIAPFLGAKRVCGDDKEMFERFTILAKRKAEGRDNSDWQNRQRENCHRVEVLVEAREFYQGSKEKFNIVADYIDAVSSDKPSRWLKKLFSDCEENTELFRAVLDFEAQHFQGTRTALALRQLHQKDPKRYRQAVAILNVFMRTNFMGDQYRYHKANDFVLANANLIDDSPERLQEVCDVYGAEFVQADRFHRYEHIPYYALEGATEAFTECKDIISAAPHLTLVCSKTAILYGKEGMHALRHIYEREPQISPYELFIGIIPSEIQEGILALAIIFEDKDSKECIETLAMAASIYQEPEVEEKRFRHHGSMLHGEKRVKFINEINTHLRDMRYRFSGDSRFARSYIEVLRLLGDNSATDYSMLYAQLDSQEKKDITRETARSLVRLWSSINNTESGQSFRALRRANFIFGDDIEKFRIFAEVIKTGGPRRFGEMILKAKEIYGDDTQKFQVFADATREFDDDFCKVLVACRELYRDDYGRLCKVRDMLNELLEPLGKFKERKKDNDLTRPQNSYYAVCDLLAATNGIYQGNEAIFIQVKELIFGLAQSGWDDAKEKLMRLFAKQAEAFNGNIEIFKEYMEMGKMKGGAALCEKLANTKEAYEGNLEILRAFRETIEVHGEAAANCLLVGHTIYQQDFACFLEVKMEVEEVKKEAGDEACRVLGETIKYYTNPPLPLFKFFAMILKEDGVTMCDNLRNTREVCRTDIEKLQITRQFFAADFDYHPVVLQKYIEVFQAEGEVRAGEYLADLREKAKQLIGPEIPESVRSMPEYPFLIMQVFPSGNYSNYKKNARCGDRLEHVQKYRFPRDGYPVKLSGLMGYKIKDDSVEDREVLKAYSQRLDLMREFIASRGPNNKELKKAFNEKVDRLFKKHCHAAFSGIEALATKEKMILLFLSEIIRRTSDPKRFQPNSEILDLVVEYKYAYEENLEAYIQHSADAIRTQRDETSQHYMLLNELSTIYGENLKHVLQHNIFGELETSERWPQIQTAYASLFKIEVESNDLTEKQWQRIRNSFKNPRIPTETRFDVLQKQIQSIFGSNIEFDRDEVRAEFYDRLSKLLTPLKENFLLEKFRSLVPALFALRQEYRFRINAKLEELFSYDINAISREIAKYEPVIDVEAKERRMGGPRDKLAKKSLKERNIRGYITKTKETANARMGAYLCIAGDESMWDNENYFELVLKDEDTGKCVGTVMLLDIRAADGKRYLWFGPNPFESFLDQVSSEQCYDYLYRTVATFAQENDFDGMVIPSEEGRILGECTNRGGNFPDLIKRSRLRDVKDKVKTVDFGKSHTLGHYDESPYSYSSGALIWQLVSPRGIEPLSKA